jgi:hypothetical protein
MQWGSKLLLKSREENIIEFSFGITVGDRLAAERMALATDPLVRLQMAGINPEVSVQQVHEYAARHPRRS